ncbi:MAG TPA: iron-sulfur cluster assembly accessory protein [Candidatus Dormibacteraeota bacterium]
MEADATGEGFDFDMIEQGTITLTDTARAQLKGLMGREENPSLALRLFVTSGGCSGFQYGMALDDILRPGDEVVELDGVRVVVDDSTLPHVRGSEIDYIDSLMGGGFTVHNPNAVQSCSCGHSFDTGDQAGNAKACGH